MKRADDNARNVAPPITWIASGMLCVLVMIALIFVFAFLSAQEILPESMISVMPPAALFIASFVSAYLSSKAQGRALLTSLIQGLVNIGLCYLTGMIVFLRIVPQVLNPYCFFACMVGAVLGGLISAGVRPRRHKIK